MKVFVLIDHPSESPSTIHGVYPSKEIAETSRAAMFKAYEEYAEDLRPFPEGAYYGNANDLEIEEHELSAMAWVPESVPDSWKPPVREPSLLEGILVPDVWTGYIVDEERGRAVIRDAPT